jgi:predicted DNA-binding ArsR family transcriptional regulator
VDSAKRCRDQSAECLSLMRVAQSETEARVLKDLAHSWIRIANQTERYWGLSSSGRR